MMDSETRRKRSTLFRLGWTWTKGEGWRCADVTWPMTNEQAWQVHQYTQRWLKWNRQVIVSILDSAFKSIPECPEEKA